MIQEHYCVAYGVKDETVSAIFTPETLTLFYVGNMSNIAFGCSKLKSTFEKGSSYSAPVLCREFLTTLGSIKRISMEMLGKLSCHNLVQLYCAISPTLHVLLVKMDPHSPVTARKYILGLSSIHQSHRKG